MHVLITGGAGFLGSHLSKALLNESYHVTVLDDLSTGCLQNVISVPSKGTFRFVKGDIRDTSLVCKVMSDVNIVIHLAAVVSVPYSVKHPHETYDVNVEGTRSLLKASVERNVERFIHVSSCAVYGEPQRLPIDEEHPARPLSPYAESKLKAEDLCRQHQIETNLETIILRPFNIYGIGQTMNQYAGVIMCFLQRLMEGKPPIIYGDGMQTRDFINVQDISTTIQLLINNQEAVGETFNLGTGIPTTINNLAKLISTQYGSPEVTPIHRPARKGDIRHSYANIQKIRNVGVTSSINLSEGLSTLITPTMTRVPSSILRKFFLQDKR